jgi:hypothetical protein
MQAELLLTSRNQTAVREMLPYFRRVSDLLESRRDPATGMALFLSGPASHGRCCHLDNPRFISDYPYKT